MLFSGKNTSYTFLYGYFDYFSRAMLLQLMLFNPRLLQDVGGYNYRLG